MKNWLRVLLVIIIFVVALTFFIFNNIIHKQYSIKDIISILKCDIDQSHIIDNQTKRDNTQRTIENC
jgi:hypothetical protein